MSVTYVFSRGDFRSRITGRDQDGIANTWNPSVTPWYPALGTYVSHYSVLEGRGLKDWTLCVVADGVFVPSQAYLDLEVLQLPEQVLSNQLNIGTLPTMNARLQLTDWGVTAVLGEQLGALLGRVAAAMGHTDDFDPAAFGLVPPEE